MNNLRGYNIKKNFKKNIKTFFNSHLAGGSVSLRLLSVFWDKANVQIYCCHWELGFGAWEETEKDLSLIRLGRNPVALILTRVFV